MSIRDKIRRSIPNKNIEITNDEIAWVRSLDDFDLAMLLSEVNDHGWEHGRILLDVMVQARQKLEASQ